MANEIRRRFNFQSGTLSGTVLVGATSLVSPKLTAFSAIGATEHAAIVLNPSGTNAEVVFITAHTAASDTATISRAREGSTAYEHGNGVTWIHAPTAYDYPTVAANTAALPSTGGMPYQGQIIYQEDTASVKVYSGSAWQEVGPLGQWAAWAPTITQSGTVTYTNSYGRYQRIGRTILAQIRGSVTGSGTTANRITFSLPVDRAYTTEEQVLGDFRLSDVSTGAVYRGQVFGKSGAQTIIFQHMPTGNFLGDGEAFGLANGDLFTITLMYEAAS